MLILWNNANLLTVFLLCPNINKIILEDSVELQWVSVLPKMSCVVSSRTHKKHFDLYFFEAKKIKLLVVFFLTCMVAYYFILY